MTWCSVRPFRRWAGDSAKCLDVQGAGLVEKTKKTDVAKRKVYTIFVKQETPSYSKHHL